MKLKRLWQNYIQLRYKVSGSLSWVKILSVLQIMFELFVPRLNFWEEHRGQYWRSWLARCGLRAVLL